MNYTKEILASLHIPNEGLVYFRDFPPYNPDLNSLARELRKDGTKSEAMLWKILKNKQTGYTFTRQKPILNYIADFYCHELRVVVEVDGSSHHDLQQILEDRERDRQMEALGLRIVRIPDYEVKRNPTEAAQIIFFKLGMEVPVL